MNIITVSNYDEMSARAAEILLAQVATKPDTLLGLATGGTPEGMYALLAEAYRAGKVSFAACKSVNLDEYVGLGPDDAASYRYFMNDKFFNHIDIKPENTHVPDGKNPNPKAACAAYDKLLADMGRIDFQILGTGHNGHIAFNEPGDHFVADTQVVDLDEMTIDANQRYFNSRDEVPRQAISMGMRPLMNSKKALMLVSGEGKAEALYRAVTGPITPVLPASILQLHRNLTIIADQAAMSKF
ncbi:MAG: glucosamine-6-phosphate deaminase [Oscillospiraceae bacterium]|nr:glucosamine-6-phosphate deaminase [Oscillospiraceae bacterium]